MTYSTESLMSFVTAMRTDMMIWPQLPPFRQPMPSGRPSRSFVFAVFVSTAIHALFAYLLCVVVTDRTTVDGPAPPSFDTPLIVSLVSLPTPTIASHDGLDRGVVSAEPHTDPVDQNSQSSPERSHSNEHKSEGESVEISNGQGVPEAEAPVGKSPAADATSSIKLEAADNIAREVARIPEFDAELVLTSKGQGVMEPEIPANKSLTTDTTPSLDLEAVYSMAREVGRMSMTEFELQDLRFKSIALYEKNHSSLDCPSAFVGGAFALPFFLKELITGNGYKWFIQPDQEILKDQYRQKFHSNLIEDLIIDPY